jgi:2-dehydro-3-deoxyphosphogluconate aldolase / (4S)-4-hydroxy-2-oxoglutarate aldolase
MKKSEVRARIEEIGIIPAIRVSSADAALFAAEAVFNSGIPIAEITMTTPGAIEVIARLTKDFPGMVVGAGTVLNTETARECLAAGAQFLTSPGLVVRVVEFALDTDVLIFPGALTPTEVIAAWQAGADFVKVFPSYANGGPMYIHALNVPLPQVSLIAAGGVNQRTAFDYIVAGAAALGIGGELMPAEAVRARKEDQIRELARRFLGMVRDARALRKGGGA